MNILYIDPIVHSKTSQVYKYYDGLYAALDKYHNCVLHTGNIEDINDVLSKTDGPIDVIVFGLGWIGFKNEIKNLADTEIVKVGFVFKPQNNLSEKMQFFKRNKFNLLLTSLPDKNKYNRLSGVKCNRLCYAANPNLFKHTGAKKKYELGFSGALHQNKIYIDGAFKYKDVRMSIQNNFLSRSDVKCFLNGSDSVAPRIVNYSEYAKKINESDMWMATPSPFGDVTPRYFEVAMSGTLLLCSEVHDEYRDIFRDGENCIEFKEDGSDFTDKFEYYRKHKDEMKQICLNAAKEFAEKHTWDNRAIEMEEMIINLRK